MEASRIYGGLQKLKAALFNCSCSTCRINISDKFIRVNPHSDVLVPAIALVENGGSFISTPKLLCIVSDLISTALVACMRDGRRCLHVGLCDGLHL